MEKLLANAFEGEYLPGEADLAIRSQFMIFLLDVFFLHPEAGVTDVGLLLNW